MPITPQRKVTNVRQLPSGRADASHFGGQEGRALQGLGAATDSVAGDLQDIQKRQDSFVAREGYNAASEQALENYTKASQLTGKNAFGVANTYEQTMGEIAKKATEGMTQRQKNIFNQNWIPKSINMRQRVSAHETNQVKAAQNAETEITIQSEKQSAAELDDNQSLAQYKASLRTHLIKNLGQTPEAAELLVEQGEKDIMALRFDKNVKLENWEEAEELAGDDPTKNKIIEQAKLSQQRRLEAEANERVFRAENRILEIQQASGNPLYLPPLETFVELWGSQELGEAAYERTSALIAKAEEDAKAPDMLTPEMFSTSIDMAQNPDRYSYEARALMGIQLRRVGKNDPGAAGLISQLQATMKESAEKQFVSPSTRERNGAYMQIFSTFRDAAFKGADTFGGRKQNLDMTSAGTVRSTDESSQELTRWLDLYDRTMSAAEQKNLDPFATEELVNKTVMEPLQLMADEKMTRENNSTWIKSGYRRLKEMNTKPAADPQPDRLYVPQGASQDDIAWLNSLINGGTNAPANP